MGNTSTKNNIIKDISVPLNQPYNQLQLNIKSKSQQYLSKLYYSIINGHKQLSKMKNITGVNRDILTEYNKKLLNLKAQFMLMLNINKTYPDTDLSLIGKKYPIFYNDMHQFNMKNILDSKNDDMEIILEIDMFREAIDSWFTTIKNINPNIKNKCIIDITYTYVLTMYPTVGCSKKKLDNIWLYIWNEIKTDHPNYFK